MLCERCKIREANIQYTEVINGVQTEHHFCTQCAREMDFGQYSAIFDGEFPLGKILSGLLDMQEASQKDDCLSQIMCPTCHTSYQEFVENSEFGCGDCYGVFDLLMEENMKQLQGNQRHTGKKPKHCKKTEEPALSLEESREHHQTDSQIEQLQRQLKQAVLQEEYEQAAKLRDEIRALEKSRDLGEEKHDEMV